MQPPPREYQSIKHYRDVAESLNMVCTIVLYSFAKHKSDTKNIIIRNFLARNIMTLKSIFSLWEISDYQGAWVLHRTLLDRMFHLHAIGSNKEFDAFDDWSFWEQVNNQNRVKSDEDFKHEAVGDFYTLNEHQKNRIKVLSDNKPKWKRPKAKNVAKDMNMDFLYKYGYDYASMHVHPMANDGQQDFFTITKLKPSPIFPSQITVLSNSILSSTMILQDSLNFSSFKWRKLLWNYIDDVRDTLNTGSITYIQAASKLILSFQGDGLCQPIEDTTNP